MREINTRELEPQVNYSAENIMTDPEAPASPEKIGLVHEALNDLIDNVSPQFVWDSLPSRGSGDLSTNINNIRLMSLPSQIDSNGRGWGESFVWVSFFDNPNGQRQIMVTEDQGSGNPLGDELGSISAGAIVRKIHRYDTAFLSSTSAQVREGHFTYGPARLEEKQNADQVNNPFNIATNAQIDRISHIMDTGSIHSHNEFMQLPPIDELEILPITNILLRNG